MKSKKRTIRAWAVIWTELARREMSVPKKDSIIGFRKERPGVIAPCRCHKTKWHYYDPLSIWTNKSAALATCWPDGKGFRVVPVLITYPAPKKKLLT